MSRSLVLILVLAAASAAAPAPAGDPLRVRSSLVATPCVEAAGLAFGARGGPTVAVETGGLGDDGDWDVVVGSFVEVNRALEGGHAVLDSDVEIAVIPWVLRGGDGELRALSDVVRSGTEIVVPAGPAAYEARRALAEEGISQVAETGDAARLRSAPVALVPVSLAGSGRHTEAAVRPIRVGAAVGVRARSAADARAFVEFLGSPSGQDAFAACGEVAQ